MKSKNMVVLIGNLGKDAEVRSVGQTKVATFSVATTEKWKGRDGEQKEATEWHLVEVWGPAADFAARLTKGSPVFVQGAIKTEKWEKDGVPRTTVKIKVAGPNSDIIGLGPKGAPSAVGGYQTAQAPPIDDEQEAF